MSTRESSVLSILSFGPFITQGAFILDFIFHALCSFRLSCSSYVVYNTVAVCKWPGLLCCVVVSPNWLALCLKHSSASEGLWGAHSGVTGSVAEEKSTALPEVGGCDDVAPLSGNSGL